MDIVELADRLWRGEDPTHKTNPLGQIGQLAEVTDGVAFLPNFANCTVIATDDGLVMVDTGSIMTAEHVFNVRFAHGATSRFATRSSPTATSTTSLVSGPSTRKRAPMAGTLPT